MSTIVNTDLSAFTVIYNNVQFGGSDAPYKSLPPQYLLTGNFRWDESHRSIIGVDYRLKLSCVFFESSESAMSVNMAAIRRKLSQPGAKLQIVGLGLGFSINADPLLNGVIVADADNGPRPVGLPQCTPI